MRDRKTIESSFHSSGRSSEGLSSSKNNPRSIYTIADIKENQELILEVLLDVRHILNGR